MAILWKKTIDGNNYEVRAAGRTRRLYTNGVFHSQYNPAHPVTGSVWDLLSLPAFFPGARPLKRILLLGVGGGAVIRQLQQFLNAAPIVGVELNPVHIEIAQRFFGISQENAILHQADAVQWLTQYRGPAFDLIIDDLFSDEHGEPVRAVAATAKWFKLLLSQLNTDGALVMNFAAASELRASAYYTNQSIQRRFKASFELSTPLYQNAVGAFLRRPASGYGLRSALADIPLLNPRLKSTRLNFRIKSL